MNQTATQNKCKSTTLRKIFQIQKITQLDILQDKYCTLNIAECLLAANLFAKLLTSIKHCFTGVIMFWILASSLSFLFSKFLGLNLEFVYRPLKSKQ